MNIETIWKHIRFCEGQVFKTVRGVEYTYLVYDNYLLINDDKRRKITKDSLITALTITNPTPSKSKEKTFGVHRMFMELLPISELKGFRFS